MKSTSINSRILHAFIAVAVLFASLAISLTWFELFGKAAVMSSTYNRRLQVEAESVIRGSIFDRQGTRLAHSEGTGLESERLYPFGRFYTHVIGYDSATYGKTLLEAQFNDALLGRGLYGLAGKATSIVTGDTVAGSNLTLTLDHELQALSRQLLGKHSGAVVAIDPKTGEILALVSTPDYDPTASALESAWPSLTEDPESPFLPRALKGLYPPGSTFKVLTAIAAMEAGLQETRFTDEGSVIIDGKTFANAGSKAHGDIGLKEALTVSSNVYFAQLAELVGPRKLLEVAARAGIGKPFAFDLPISDSRIGALDMGRTELAATAIGQGKLMVTPLQMALIAAGIANDGVIMKPALISSIDDAAGTRLFEMHPEKLSTLTDPDTALQLTIMMDEAVRSGTGTRAQIGGISVAGKTGTAQNERSAKGDGNDHAWFIGFAPASDPKIAVAVLLEYQGKGGGQAAAPIARQVMAQWLNSEVLRKDNVNKSK